jgi:hypothetical protein
MKPTALPSAFKRNANRDVQDVHEAHSKHPAKLSITHISGSDLDANLDVRQAGRAAPHDDVPGWRIAGSGEIAAEARELGQVVR